jgi:molybdenum cofactor cytidylyltransferase
VKESAENQRAVAGLLLAAGASQRMGRPKQLLPYRGRSLLRHAAETALAAGCSPLVIVTGALHEELMAEVSGLPVEVVHNPEWQQGMGSSIQVGMQLLEALPAAAKAASVMMTLTDQPLVTAVLLRTLLTVRKATHAPAVATSYANTVGVPALFGREVWQQLKELPAQAGAKKLLDKLGDEVVTVPFPAAAVDVDTPAQYQALVQQAAAIRVRPHS